MILPAFLRVVSHHACFLLGSFRVQLVETRTVAGSTLVSFGDQAFPASSAVCGVGLVSRSMRLKIR